MIDPTTSVLVVFNLSVPATIVGSVFVTGVAVPWVFIAYIIVSGLFTNGLTFGYD